MEHVGLYGRVRYFETSALQGVCADVRRYVTFEQSLSGLYRAWLCVKSDGTRTIWFLLTRQERDAAHVKNVRYSLDHRHFDGGRQFTEELYIHDANSYVVLSTEQVMSMSRPPMWEDERLPTRLNKDGVERIAQYLDTRLNFTEDRGCHEELRQTFVAPLVAARRLLEENRHVLAEREARRGPALDELLKARKTRKLAARAPMSMQLFGQHGYFGRIRYFDTDLLLAANLLPFGHETLSGKHRPWLCVKSDGSRTVWFLLTRQERDPVHDVRYSLDHRHFDGGRKYGQESYIHDANSYVVLSTEQVMSVSRPPMWEDERLPTRLNKDGVERIAQYLDTRLNFTEDRGCHEELRQTFVVPLIAQDLMKGDSERVRKGLAMYADSIDFWRHKNQNRSVATAMLAKGQALAAIGDIVSLEEAIALYDEVISGFSPLLEPEEVAAMKYAKAHARVSRDPAFNSSTMNPKYAIEALLRATSMTKASVSVLLGYSGHNPTHEIDSFLKTSENPRTTDLDHRAAALALETEYFSLIKPKVYRTSVDYLFRRGYTHMQAVGLEEYFASSPWRSTSLPLSSLAVDWSQVGICTADQKDVHVCPICAEPCADLLEMQDHIISTHGEGNEARAIFIAFAVHFRDGSKTDPQAFAAVPPLSGIDDALRQLRSYNAFALGSKVYYIKAGTPSLRVVADYTDADLRKIEGSTAAITNTMRLKEVPLFVGIALAGCAAWRSKADPYSVVIGRPDAAEGDHELVWVEQLPFDLHGTTPFKKLCINDFAVAEKTIAAIEASTEKSGRAISSFFNCARTRFGPEDIFMQPEGDALIVTDCATLEEAPQVEDFRPALRNLRARLFVHVAEAIRKTPQLDSEKLIRQGYESFYPGSATSPTPDTLSEAVKLGFDEFHIDYSAAFEGAADGGASRPFWFLPSSTSYLSALIEFLRHMKAPGARAGRGGSAAVYAIGRFMLRVDAAARPEHTQNGNSWPRHIRLLNSCSSQALQSQSVRDALSFPIMGCWAWRARNDHSALSLTASEFGSDVSEQVWVEVLEKLCCERGDEVSITSFGKAHKVTKAIKASVECLNGLGLSHGDLKLPNLFIKQSTCEDASVTYAAILIDWTSLCSTQSGSSDAIPLMSTRGYFAKDTDTGMDHDAYALEVMKAQLFVSAAKNLRGDEAGDIQKCYNEWYPGRAEVISSFRPEDAAVTRGKLLLHRFARSYGVDSNTDDTFTDNMTSTVAEAVNAFVTPLTHDHGVVTAAVAELIARGARHTEDDDDDDDEKNARLLEYDTTLGKLRKSVTSNVKESATDAEASLPTFFEAATETIALRNTVAKLCLSVLHRDNSPTLPIDLYLRRSLACQTVKPFISTSSVTLSAAQKLSRTVRDTIYSFVHAVAVLEREQLEAVASQYLTEVCSSGSEPIGIDDILERLDVINRERSGHRMAAFVPTDSILADTKHLVIRYTIRGVDAATKTRPMAIVRFGRVLSIARDKDGVLTVTFTDPVPMPGDASFAPGDDAWASSLLLASLSPLPREVRMTDETVQLMELVFTADVVTGGSQGPHLVPAIDLQHQADYISTHYTYTKGHSTAQVVATLEQSRGVLESFTAIDIDLSMLTTCLGLLVGNPHLSSVRAQVEDCAATEQDLKQLVHTCGYITGCDVVEITCPALMASATSAAAAAAEGQNAFFDAFLHDLSGAHLYAAQAAAAACTCAPNPNRAPFQYCCLGSMTLCQRAWWFAAWSERCRRAGSTTSSASNVNSTIAAIEAVFETEDPLRDSATHQYAIQLDARLGRGIVADAQLWDQCVGSHNDKKLLQFYFIQSPRYLDDDWSEEAGADARIVPLKPVGVGSMPTSNLAVVCIINLFTGRAATGFVIPTLLGGHSLVTATHTIANAPMVIIRVSRQFLKITYWSFQVVWSAARAVADDLCTIDVSGTPVERCLSLTSSQEYQNDLLRSVAANVVSRQDANVPHRCVTVGFAGGGHTAFAAFSEQRYSPSGTDSSFFGPSHDGLSGGPCISIPAGGNLNEASCYIHSDCQHGLLVSDSNEVFISEKHCVLIRTLVTAPVATAIQEWITSGVNCSSVDGNSTYADALAASAEARRRLERLQ